MNTDLPIVIRQATDNDLGYILVSWSKTIHKTVPYNFIPNEIFSGPNGYQTKIIERALNKSITLVAHVEDEPDQIAGFIVVEPHDDANLILHWCQVKAIFRRYGIAKELLAKFDYKDKNLICPQYFKLFKDLREKYHLIFDPRITGEV